MTTPFGVTHHLQQRVSDAELRLDAVVDALRLVVEALEGSPLIENANADVARAARQAHERLLAAGLREPD